jgi:hypothetical protein
MQPITPHLHRLPIHFYWTSAKNLVKKDQAQRGPAESDLDERGLDERGLDKRGLDVYGLATANGAAGKKWSSAASTLLFGIRRA